MVLSFALCATFAFAQTNKIAAPTKSVDVSAAKAIEQDVKVQKSGYTGSIFTKDDELFVCTFADATTYSTGIVGEGEMVNGTNVAAHAQTAFHSQWRCLPSNDTNAINAFNPNSPWGSTNYPATYDMWRSYICGYNGATVFGSTTADEGIMVMTMQDQISAWGGSGFVGNFNAYIAFPSISTVGEPLIRARFYQYYRCFNNDKCWIDYSTDGNTWSAIEFNVRGVDVEGNSSLRGWKTITLPNTVGNQSNVYLRIRWSCESNVGGAYGYFWFVDDFQVIPAVDNNLVVKSNQYFEGFYQTMPQNFDLPVVWVSEFTNEGRQNQTNITGHVYAMSEGNAATEIVNKNIGTAVPDPINRRAVIIDPLGWYDSSADYHGRYYNPNATGTGSVAYLPTNTLGNNYFFSDLTTDYYTPHIYENETFDTVIYKVNWGTTSDGHAYGVWGRDHGVIRGNSYYTPGVIREENGTTIYSDEPEDGPMWNQAGYGVFVSYVTGDTVPVDANGNHWRILGMEMVASTYAGRQSAGARLEPVLFYDNIDSTGELAGWRGIATGASTYVVSSSDVIPNSVLSDEETPFTYEVNGYPVIRIMFPNQPELIPNFTYRAGYNLAEEADFCLSTTAYFFYNDEGVATSFADEPGMEAYATTLGVTNPYSVFVTDPYDGYVHYFPATTYPMIRLLVGPSYYVPKVAVSLQCDNPDEGNFIDGQYNDLCGTVDSVPVGGSASYIVMPVPGYEIDKVYLDGEEIEYEPQQDADGTVYGIVSLENIDANCVLRCSFKERTIGFDPIANVSMRLMPNPATSNVNVVMKGVTGTVNMALIDMSGRVVTTSQFNAENGTNINVSNLAKGAYFVRITNNKFSKIEKLIVR